MANLKNIRSQIKSVTSIQKVTKAMKMVAAAKLRKSQENFKKNVRRSEEIKPSGRICSSWGRGRTHQSPEIC